jgi:hypothetical protein
VSGFRNRLIQRATAPGQQCVSSLNDMRAKLLHEPLTGLAVQRDVSERTSDEYVHLLAPMPLMTRRPGTAEQVCARS